MRRKAAQINLSNKFARTNVISQERRSIHVFLRAIILRRHARLCGKAGGETNIKHDDGMACSRGQGRDYNSECNVCIFDIYDLSNPAAVLSSARLFSSFLLRFFLSPCLPPSIANRITLFFSSLVFLDFRAQPSYNYNFIFL